jgi:hypothetical protein
MEDVSSLGDVLTRWSRRTFRDGEFPAVLLPDLVPAEIVTIFLIT